MSPQYRISNIDLTHLKLHGGNETASLDLSRLCTLQGLKSLNETLLPVFNSLFYSLQFSPQ